MQQWSSLLNHMLDAGIPLIDTIELATKSLSNEFLQYSLMPIKSQLKNGLTFYDAISKVAIFPASYLQMILIGEGERTTIHDATAH